MKLSIVTINYNNAEGLRKTLASVASQTYADIEHVIVDGGSTDGSVEVIREYEQSLASRLSPLASNLKWVSEKDTGIYNAMNKGIEIAIGRRIVNAFNRSELVEDKYNIIDRSECNEDKNKGIEVALGKRVVNDDHTSSPIANNQLPIALTDYIQILNSGDILVAPDVTERMFQAMGNRQWAIDNKTNRQSPIANSPQIPIFYGNMIKEYPDGLRTKDTCGGEDYTPESFLYFYKGTLNHDCAYIRRDLFEKYGLYNEEMKICSDWEWYVRAIVLGGEKTVYTNIDVTVFDMTGISESNGKNKDIIQKERREYLESILPAAVLRDYDMYSLPIEQYRRLKKYHLWGVVYFVERVLFKLEKWGFLRR